MLKLLSVFVLFAVFLAEVSSQHIILPTYRPPPRRPVIIRTVRETGRDEPKWLFQGDIPRAPATGDHTYLPPYIDDIKLDPNTRVARSLGTPNARSYGGQSRSSSKGKDTGATHPGYNRRNARDVHTLPTSSPFNPRPFNPRPFNPRPFNPRPFNPRPFNPSPFNPRPFNPLPRLPTYIA